MDDVNRSEEETSSGSESGLGTRDATGSPSEGGRMDEGLHQARGRAVTTSGLENEIEGAGIHGAAEAEADRAQPGSGAQEDARSGAEKAFPESSDSEHRQPG